VAQKKSYSRYFIILQEDETGYSLASDKLPSGYTKLETKNERCKISYYVQNLKKNKEPYYMVLICNKKDAKKLIKLGMLNIDDYGRAEITYEYTPDNILDSKISVDAVGGAAIVRVEGSKLISVMSGFTSSEPPADWRNYSLFEDKAEQLRTESVEEKLKEEPKLESIKEREEPKAEADEKEENNIFDEYEQQIEVIREEEKLIETEPSNEVEVLEEKINEREQENTELEDGIVQVECEIPDSSYSDKIDEEQYRKKHHEDKKEDYGSGTVGEFFKLVVDGFEEVKGICTEIKKCKWYKVPAKNINDMSNSSNYNKYTMVYYPMISYYPYLMKQEHYFVGYKFDSEGNIKYLIYGIPGTKKRCDQPYEGRSGFVTWVPFKEGDERDDSAGCWIMFYDFRTSTIVIPIK
jgi:hypothetical protein